MTSICYRTAEKAEEESIHRLQKEMLRAVYGIEEDQQIPQFSPEPIDRFLEETGSCIFVAETAGRVVGFLSVEDHGSFLYLDDLCVEQEHREKGIGTHLLCLAEEHAETRKIKTLELHVEGCNRRAMAMYNRLGYTITETIQDRHRMRKELP